MIPPAIIHASLICVLYSQLDGVLSLRPRATGVGTICVTRKLNLLSGRELQDFLEPTANVEQDVLALLTAATLTASNVAVTSVGNVLAGGASPDTNTVEGLAHIDHNAHDLAIVLLFERLANSRHHHLKPEAIDFDTALILVLVRPLATVLVLGVLPFGTDASLEQVVVGLLGKLGDGGDIVL